MGTTTAAVSASTAAAAAMRRPIDFNSCSNCCCKITNISSPPLRRRRRRYHHQLKTNSGENNSRSTGNFGKLELAAVGRIGIETPSKFQRIGQRLSCRAMEQSQSTSVYQGVYGPWTIDSSDVREVILYRSGLVTAALSFVLASSTAILPGNTFVSDIVERNLDLLYVLGSAGLGLSLYLIHIYVTEIKRTLQALWGLGVIGSVVTYTALAVPAGEGLVQYVVDNPTAVWLVGPVFAALTGLVFKEGLCYGKLEAAALTIIVPTTLLGHLTGIMDDAVKLSLLGVWMTLFIIFAGRKFTQPVKDDIGDKSVFIFNALPEEEKAALLEKLGQQRF